MNKKVIRLGGMLVLAVVAVGTVMYIAAQTRTTNDVAVNQACHDMIGEWNDLMGDGATLRTTEDLEGQITEVESRSGYKDDPTCQHILFKAYLTTAGASGAETALGTLKEQTSTGQNPSIQLVDITSVAEMEQELQSLREYQESSHEVDEDGLTNAG